MNYCKTCGFLDRRQNVCQLTGWQVQPNNDFCFRHQEEVDKCDFCGSPVIDPLLYLNEDQKVFFVCHSCKDKFGTCGTCKRKQDCSFIADQSMPDMVQKQIRQGNMTTVMPVMNPQKIEKHCKNGCVCFDAEFGCLKQNCGTCGKYEGEI